MLFAMAGQDFIERSRQVGLFQLLEHAVVGAVPGVQQGVRGDVDRQVAAVDAIEHLGEAAGDSCAR